MLLKTNQTSIYGGKIGLPEVGETDVNNEGIIDVPQEVAELLLQGSDWEEVEGTSGNKKKAPESTKKVSKTVVPASKPEEQNPPAANPENEKLIAAIDKMELEELIEYAKKAEIKGYGLFKTDVQKMRTFMKKKVLQ